MKNVKMIIEYDGSRYNGWQRLGDTDNTVQAKLEGVISKMVNSKVEIIGSGRTDKGVHARNQVANFKTSSHMSCKDMLSYLNGYLPSDIVVKSVSFEDERFHSRYNADKKRYSYYIWNSPIPSAFNRKYSYHVPDKLNLDAVVEARNKLLGTHDFIGFSSIKKSKKSTTRTVYSIDIRQEGNMVIFDFTANGFLYNMVRIMMGSLLEIGLGQKSISHIDDVFSSSTRSIAGRTVPAQGLFLEDVFYGDH